MSLFSIRQIPIFVLACVPILAEPIADILRRTEEWLRADGRLGATALLTTALALAIVAFGYALELRDIPRRGWFDYAGMISSFPARACDAIDAHDWNGNLLNDYKWGGYCIWRWYPRRKVFIDGRAEVYFRPRSTTTTRSTTSSPTGRSASASGGSTRLSSTVPLTARARRLRRTGCALMRTTWRSSSAAA